MANVNKLVVAFDERRHSLMKDGYNIVTSSYTDKFMYNKFRHRNGNYVSIIAHIDDSIIIQRTNGRIVHYEKVH